MPDLTFAIDRVEAVTRGLAPLLHFKVLVQNEPATEVIHGAILNAQIQIQSPRRRSTLQEKEKLFEIFGPPERWGDTLRNRFWTHASATLPTFSGRTEAVLPVACTFDLNVLATKYFCALESGDIPLVFYWSGSVFYAAADGRLQMQRISWEKECAYRMPLPTWQALMEQHFPNAGWLTLRRDVFDRLCAVKRRRGIMTWEEMIDDLLLQHEGEGAPA